MTFEERLFDKRLITSDGHWLFVGAINTDGYGLIMFNGKLTKVNRVAAHLWLGLDLNDRYQQALHKDELCRQRSCFNPEHLYIGNNSINMKDAVKLKTHNRARNTHCPQGHEYTEENTYTAEGCRRCKICRSNQNSKQYDKRRVKK